MKNTSKKSAVQAVLVFLFRHWRREKWSVACAALLMMALTSADLLMPVFSGRLVDAIAGHNADRQRAVHAAAYAIAGIAAMGAISISARFLAMLVIIRLNLRVMVRCAGDAFWRVQRFSTEWHADSFAGSTVRRISRGIWAVDQLNDTFLLALWPALLVLVGSSLLLGLRWPVMGVIVVAGASVYAGITVTLALRYVAPAARLSNAQDTKFGGAMADAVTCNTVVKAFGAEEREDMRLARVLFKWRNRTARYWTFGQSCGSAQFTVLLLLRTFVTSFALWLWWLGRATPGDVTFVLTSYFVVNGYLRDIGWHALNLQRGVNDMEDMVNFHALSLGVIDQTGSRPICVNAGEIVFDNVTFQYGAHAEPLFREFSLCIEAGERVGLVGHSGSGKSTFVKLLHRLYDLSEGRILIDGQDISAVTQDSLRSQLALVPQEPVLFHRSLAENIAYGRPHATMQQIEEAARQANADEFIERQPKGYRTLVGERGVKLSGGGRQRIALARAFLANTPVLLLDEATSSLDSESEALIHEAMERLIAGRTAIVIAHRLSTVRMLDRILVFDRGEVIEEGSHDELVRRPGGTYKRLFERQALGFVSDEVSDFEKSLQCETVGD